MSEWWRALLAGVGGQGVMSAGRWIGEAAASCSQPVVVRQVHGLSQRGGSVQSAVVIGGARSPEIPDGSADMLVALDSEGNEIPGVFTHGNGVWEAGRVDFRGWGLIFDGGFGRTLTHLDAPNASGRQGLIAFTRGRNEYEASRRRASILTV